MTDPRLIGTLGQPFPEQVAAFRLRLGNLIDTQRWDDIQKGAHDTGFMVAGATKADVLADLAAAVDKAISQGTSLEEFRRDFRRIVAERGWTGWTGEGSKKGEAWRTRVIYQTNMRVSFASARRAQLIEAGYALWIYKHGGSRDPRPEHLAMNGITLPPDHDFWTIWSPPNGWGCSCRVVGARSERGAHRLGGDPDKALPEWWNRPDPRTGAPHGIDKGWDYAPGATVSDRVRIIDGKLPQLPPQIGAAFAAANRRTIEYGWEKWLSELGTRRDAPPGLAGYLTEPVLAALQRHDIVPQSAEMMVMPGLVRGPKAARHEAKGDALKRDDWRRLPERLDQPLAVLHDIETGRVLYLLPSEDGAGQLAMAVDYRLKGRRGAPAVTTNMIVSAYKPDIAEMRRRIAAGRVVLILGNV